MIIKCIYAIIVIFCMIELCNLFIKGYTPLPLQEKGTKGRIDVDYSVCINTND